MSLMKKFLELRRKRRLEKYQRMNSEVLCSILYDTMREQTKEGINIPTFMLVNQRYNKLGITCPKDLERVYTEFFLQGKVSGIEL